MKKSWPWSSGPKAPKPNYSEINHFAYGAWIGLSLGLCAGMLQWSGPVYFLLGLFSAGVMGRVFRELAIESRSLEPSPQIFHDRGTLSLVEVDADDDRSMESDDEADLSTDEDEARGIDEGLAKAILFYLLFVTMLFVFVLGVCLKLP